MIENELGSVSEIDEHILEMELDSTSDPSPAGSSTGTSISTGNSLIRKVFFYISHANINDTYLLQKQII